MKRTFQALGRRAGEQLVSAPDTPHTISALAGRVCARSPLRGLNWRVQLRGICGFGEITVQSTAAQSLWSFSLFFLSGLSCLHFDWKYRLRLAGQVNSGRR